MRKVFSMDLRSLALMRFCLGLVTFAFFFFKLPYATTFYSSSGILNRAFFLEYFKGVDTLNLLIHYSEPWFVQLLFGLGLFFSLCFTIGLRSRLSGWILWFITLTLQGRFPLSLNGGDIMLPLLFLWANFLPVGKAHSWDSSFTKECYPFEGDKNHYSMGSIAWFLQVFVVYFMTALYKDHPYWHSSGEAMGLALNLDSFTTSLGLWLKGYKGVLPWLSRITFMVELVGPILIFIPHRIMRLSLVSLFLSFHFGIFLTFDLGVFPFICMILWLPLIPSSFWQRSKPPQRSYFVYYDKDCGFCRRMGNLILSLLATQKVILLPSSDKKAQKWGVHQRILKENSWCGHYEGEELSFHWDNFINISGHSSFKVFRFFIQAIPSHWGKRSYYFVANRRPFMTRLTLAIGSSSYGTSSQWALKFKAGSCLGLCLLSLWYNLGDFGPLRKFQMTGAPRNLSFLLGLDQRWDMFGPFPASREGWPVLMGTLADGSKIDIWNKKNLDFTKPKNPKYESIFWRKSWERLSSVSFQGYRGPLVRYLCREWNQFHGNTEKRLRSVRIYYLIEHSPISSQERIKFKRDDLGSFGCP